MSVDLLNQLRLQISYLEERIDVMERIVNSIYMELHRVPAGKVPSWIMAREIARIEAKTSKV